MKAAGQTLWVVVGGAVLLSACCAVAQDWPQWRGPNRDGKVIGFQAPQDWPKEFSQKWKSEVGLGDATPALVDDKLYVFTRQGDEEVVLCLSAADGKQLWRTSYAAQEVKGAAGRHPGPRSSPAVAEGKVVTLGVGGVLSCWDAASGKKVWQNDKYSSQVPKFFTGMSPIIAEGLAIAHLGGEEGGSLVAFDLAGGDEKWKWSGEGPAYGSPVLMNVDGAGQLVAQTEESIVGIALADGKLLWQIATPIEGRVWNSATPIVDGQVAIHTGHGTGTQAVTIEKQGNKFTTKELWSNAEVGTGYNTPVLKDGLLFGLSNRGSFFCLDAKTGETAWVAEEARRDNFCAMIDAGSALIALPSSGDLIAIAPTKEKYHELARIKVSETPVYAHPLVTNQGVYVKGQDNVALWTF